MAIENTLLYNEFKQIANSGSKPIFALWTCEIYAGKEMVKPFRIKTIDINRNYDTEYSDIIVIETLIPEGTFNSKIRPFEDNLEIQLFKNPLGEVGTTPNQEVNTESQRYRATIIEDGTTVIKKATPDNLDIEGADLTNLKTVYFQLVDIVSEQLRMRTTGGIFIDAIPALVLRTILGKESKKVSGAGDQIVRGVDLVEPSNNKVYKHVIIPEGTRVVDLPKYIQEKCNGIYSSGIGYYLQKGLWYVYPLYDIERYPKTPKTLTILNIPEDKFPNIERTYRVTANQVIVLSTAGLKHFDDSESLQLNEGNGVRFTDASVVVEGFGKHKPGEYVVDRKVNNTEMMFERRKTGNNHTPVARDPISSNPFVEYSRLARRAVTHVQMVWENSNDSLIYPGMPAKIVYENNNEVEEIEGVVLRAQHFITGQGQSMVDSRHITQTVLTLIIKRLV